MNERTAIRETASPCLAVRRTEPQSATGSFGPAGLRTAPMLLLAAIRSPCLSIGVRNGPLVGGLLVLVGTTMVANVAMAESTPSVAAKASSARVSTKEASVASVPTSASPKSAAAVAAVPVTVGVLRVQLNDLAQTSPTPSSESAHVAPSLSSRGGAKRSTTLQPAIADAKVTTLDSAPIEAVVLHSDNSRTQLDTNAASVTLRPGDLLITRSANAPEAVAKSQVEGATSVKLAYEVLFLDEQGRARHCELVAEMAGGGMRLVGDDSAFTTQIYVGLRDHDHWDSVYSLPRPLRLLVTGNVDKVAPDLVTIEQTDDFKPVELRAADPSTEVKVQVRAADKGLELDVPVHRPRATIDVNPKTIQGFGLESAQVNIRTEGLSNPKGRSVRLQTSSGRLKPVGLTLDENGVAHAELRSAGFGPVSVEVSVFQLTPDKSDIEFAWPWRFLAFALLGGLLGSAIQWLRASGERQPVGWKPLLSGVLTGVMAAAASAVGVNLLSIDLPSLGGESLALVIAALGAWGLVKVRPSSA